MKQPHPAAQHVIDKCGGARRVAELLQINPASVYRWPRARDDNRGANGLIPMERAWQLLEEARRAGIPLEPADFFQGALTREDTR